MNFTEEDVFKLLQKLSQQNEKIEEFYKGWTDYQNILLKPNNINNLQSKTKGEQIMRKIDGKTITKRKDRKNCWMINFRKNGIHKVIYGKTQQEVINKYKLSLKVTNNQIQQKYTLKEWFVKFLSLYKIGKVRETTVDKDKQIFTKFKKIENLELDKITQLQFQELINKEKSNNVKRKMFILLNCMLEKAVNLDLIEKNICKKVEKPKYKAKEKNALTRTEENIFIENCKKSPHGDFFLTALYQGLRRGECWALRVNDIDLINNTLRIDESRNMRTNDNSTKNEQSNRVMPLFYKTKEILERLIKNKKQDDYIFNISEHNITTTIKQLANHVKDKQISPHILRHTFITRCQENKIPLYLIQSWVGHQKGSIVTTKIYTHLNEETNLKYTEIMNKNN